VMLGDSKQAGTTALLWTPSTESFRSFTLTHEKLKKFPFHRSPSAAFHWDRDCDLPEARAHFKKKVPTPFHQTASAMHAMIEDDIYSDSIEVYDEEHEDQVDYAHVAFHIPQTAVDDACFQSRGAVPVSSIHHHAPSATLTTLPVSSPAVVSEFSPQQSVATAPVSSDGRLAILSYMLVVFIFLAIPDKLQAVAVSSFACLVAHFPSLTSSFSSVISSISAYMSSLSPARTYKLSFATLCVSLLILLFCLPDAIFDEPPSTWSSTPDSSTPDSQLYTPALDPDVSRDVRTNPIPGRQPRVLDFNPASLPSVGVLNLPASPPSVGAVSDLPVSGPFTPTHSPPPSPAPVRRSNRIAAHNPAEHSVISAPANPVQPVSSPT